MEWADILHVLWIGVARDVSGSVLMEVCERSADLGASWDVRLLALHARACGWCKENKIRPSTLEPFSLWIGHGNRFHMLLKTYN